MGHIFMMTEAFGAGLSEDVGERSGLALDREQLLEHLPATNPLYAMLQGEQRLLRVQSEVYADAVGDLLFALGAAEEPGMPTIGSRLIKRLGPDWRSVIDFESLLLVETIARHFVQERARTGHFDREAMEAALIEHAGDVYLRVLDDLLVVLPIYLAHCPYLVREISAHDTVALTDLFLSERLPIDGSFLDQRFVNYLAARAELLPSIHWRQFEMLAAEWLNREGYEVELGPGRDDGGVDVRAWRRNVVPGTPPAIIVQCKRQQNKVDKQVVKALWADLSDERAEAGLIVTTSDLSPGAAEVVAARAYPVTVANGNQVKSWVAAMRCPAAGLIL